MSEKKNSVITRDGPALIYCDKRRSCCAYGNEGCWGTFYRYLDGREEFRYCSCS